MSTTAPVALPRTMAVGQPWQMDEQRARLTLVRPTGAPVGVDVLVGGPTGTTWADVAALLGEATGWPAGEIQSLAAPETLIGTGALHHGAVLGGRPATRSPGLLQLRVEHGPDAGRVIPLPRGTHVLGRGAATLSLDSDATVSRSHARLQVDGSGVTVEPCRSANPALIDGVPITGPTPLRVHDRLQVGRTRLRLHIAGQPGAGAGSTRDTDVQPRHFALPAAPEPSTPAEFPWLIVLAGLALTGVLAVVMRSKVFLILGLLSPVVAGGQWATQRRSARRSTRHRQDEHDRRCTRIREQVRVALAEELAVRRQRLPSLDLLPAMTGEGRDRVHADGTWASGQLCVGVGPIESQVRVESDGRIEQRWLTEAPISVELPDLLVLRGPRPRTLALARSLVAQLAARHPPSALVLSLVTARPHDWEWFGWLPHAEAVSARGERGVAWRVHLEPGDVGAEALARLTQVGDPTQGSVLIWDRPTTPPQLPGVHALWCPEPGSAASAAREATTTVVEFVVGHDGRLSGPGGYCGTADLPSPTWANRLARALATQHGCTAHRAGHDVRLVELLAARGPDEIVRGWGEGGGGLVATLGILVDEPGSTPAVLDLHRDGPHLLIAGTTGAGKSQALRSLVAGLAVLNPPDHVAFVLVDFKGGAAFGRCADLPHTVGVVTDLDPKETGRALAGLHAEIRRREHLFASVQAADLEEYRLARARHGLPQLARVVIVIDEFRVLAEELPDVLTSLVRLAGLGRSLGLHLVIATQRPAGAISADIRANVTARLALRTADPIESRDVVDCPDAAWLPTDRPGRAILRVAGDAPHVVQCARVDAHTPTLRPWAALAGWPGGTARESARRTDSTDSDLDVLIRDIAAAAHSCGVQPAPPLWSPALPRVLSHDDLRARTARPGASAAGLPLGLRDDPQDQQALWWDPAGHGSLAVIGSSGSGRRTLVRRLLWCEEASRVDWYVLDLAGGLADAAGLPWVGAVSDGRDLEHAARLLQLLAEPAGRVRVLIVHGWDELARDPSGSLLEQVTRLAGAGRGAPSVVVTGGRALLGGRGCEVAGRVILRLSDPADAAVLGVRRDQLPSPWPPGRAVVVLPGEAGPQQVQIALPAPVEALPVTGNSTAGSPTPVPTLPEQVPATDLPPPAAGRLPLGLTPTGVARWDLASHPRLLALGPPGSGRSTLLAWLCGQAEAAGWQVLRSVTGTRPTSIRATDHPGTLILLDDLDRAESTELNSVHRLIEDLTGAGPVALAATAASGGYPNGLVASWFAGRCLGVVLNPAGPREGERFGARTPVLGADRPGRGVIIQEGRCQAVQLAMPAAGGVSPRNDGAWAASEPERSASRR